MRDKVLSQAEIEALLGGLAPESESADSDSADAGVAPGKAAKAYDFRRPDKFSKEHLRALRILHESFARLLASSLTSYLSTSVAVHLTMLEQVAYDDYVRSLPTPTVVYLVGLAPLPGQAVVEINLPVARTILDRLLGGNGLIDPSQVEMTEIEMALLKTVGGFITSSLRETWANVLSLRPTTQEPVLSPELAQFAMLAESTVMLVAEVHLFNTTGTLSMCIPYPVLQPIMDDLIAQVWFGGSQAIPSEDQNLELHRPMNEVVLPLSVSLGRANLTVRELLELASGQVIKLDISSTGQLPVRIGDHVKFLGRPGLNGKNVAVQITSAPLT